MAIHEPNIKGRSPVVGIVNNLNYLLHSTCSEPTRHSDFVAQDMKTCCMENEKQVQD